MIEVELRHHGEAKLAYLLLVRPVSAPHVGAPGEENGIEAGPRRAVGNQFLNRLETLW
jgi:hypothetical protein